MSTPRWQRMEEMVGIAPTHTESLSPFDNIGDRSYPTRDGRPMGETDVHRNVMFDLIGALELYYAGQQVYVSGNILLFYEKGNRRRHVSPDVLVTKQLRPGRRLNYILWQEGLPPSVVIEVTSASTRSEDVEKKFQLYQDIIRVQEYFLFDPFGDYLTPSLQGYRLEDGRYRSLPLLGERMESKELGLDLEKRGEELWLYERRTGRRLLPPRELASEQAAEIARLQAEIERLRNQ